MSVALQDAILLEDAINPNTDLYQRLMNLLLKPREDGKTRKEKLASKGAFKYVLPYRGDPEEEMLVTQSTPLVFADRGVYRNGVASLAQTAAELIDLVVTLSGRSRLTASLVVTAEHESLQGALASSGSVSSLVYYAGRVNLVDRLQSLDAHLETLVVDHTTVNLNIDEVLNFSYRAGIKVVDGVFPYHVAATKGWDVVAGPGHWSYTHHKKYLSVGPDDDSTRLLKYKHDDYRKFVDPSLWSGHSRKYVYEIRKIHNGLATYRAVFVGGYEFSQDEKLSFKLPTCSSEDMVLVSINRDLAAGVFVSRSNNAHELAETRKDYAIEVRKDLFVSCVNFLVSKEKGADIVGDAIRYVYAHNYVDLMDGIRVIRRQSLSYADGLCVAMVCALTAFDLRYRLTSESIPSIQRARKTAQLLHSAPLGALGRLAWMMSTYVTDAFADLSRRSVDRVADILDSTDYIPGVCFDVYMDMYYQPKGEWFEAHVLEVQEPVVSVLDAEDEDPFVNFFGGTTRAYAPTVLNEKVNSVADQFGNFVRYEPNVIPDPVTVLQNAYDMAFPGNSTAQLANVAELRRVNSVNINTEFYGRIEINKDIAAPERLHGDMPLRTAALPVSRTPLIDAIMASAKRNFNPPDMQLQSNVWDYAKYLVKRFADNCFIKGFDDTVGKSYRENPISFNVSDYLEWRAMKDGAYRSALEAECPADMVELELEKYDTIVKKRIKPKLSTMAQHELAQPQVIVSMSKKDTAPFTSVFRRVFERFDNALKPEFKSAGRSSDEDISRWATQNRVLIRALRAVEIDSGKYDKSQNLLARLIESCVFIMLGLDPGVMEIFSDSYVGRVSSKVLGLMFVSAYQMKSGAPQTMLGNLVYNMVSAGECVGYDSIRLSVSKGDDNVLWLRAGVSASLAVSKLSNLFNLEVKLIEGSVLCFSSGYFVYVGDFVFFVSDPVKILDLLGEGGSSPDVIRQKFESFGDRIASYTVHHAVPGALQQLVRRRLGVPALPVVEVIDAFVAVARDFSLYERIVQPS